MKTLYYIGCSVFLCIALFAAMGIAFAQTDLGQISQTGIVLIFLCFARMCQAAAHSITK